jgi:polysaccharide biosynthesis/export protein
VKKILCALVVCVSSASYASAISDAMLGGSIPKDVLFQNNASTTNTNGIDNGMVPPISSNIGSLSSMSSIMNGGQVDSITNNAPSSSGDTPAINPPNRPRPPMEPNEFQQSVQIRTGLMLQQYGYSLFNLPNTFTPVNNLPIDNNYTLGPGDQIFIQSWGSVSISYTANVSSDGTIYIPKIGTFNVTGIKAGSLEKYLKSRIGKVYKKFQLSATVSKIRSIQVNVAGYAEVPGTYTVSSLTSLANAIFAAGGPSNNGSLRHVQLKRNGVTVDDFDMYDILLKGDNSHDVRLLPGDIIYFMPKGNEVAIYDGVKQPAIYEAKSGEDVNDILKFAGGASFDNLKSKVVLEQINDNKISVLDYSYKDGLNQAVSNAMIIHFMRMNKAYDKTVVLMGNVANPTRIMYTEGMRIHDVIPNKAALLTKSFWDSYSYNTYGKDYVLTQTGLEKTNNRFGNSGTSYSTSSGLSAVNTNSAIENSQSGNLLRDHQFDMKGVSAANSNKDVFTDKDNLLVAGPINIPEADINWNYAAIIRIDPKDYSSHVIPFNLKLAIEGDPKNNIKLQAGDVINILSSKDVRNPVENKTIFVFVDGEVRKPGLYELKPGELLTETINRAGGLSSKAYLFGMELDRKSVKKKQERVLNQMLDQAQQTLMAQSSSAGLSAINAAQVQIQAQILQQQQAMIDKMRQVKPTGRVVLKIDTNNAKLKDLPNFEMENGDTVYIPPRPDTVDVVGQVFNPATFSYEKGLDVGDYINQAGGENNFADTSNEYVLQANGVLYSRNQAGWFGRFTSRDLNPGDTVIVPQQIQFGSTLQNVMNWTQILANFGTSAAAIQVFK